MDKSHRPKSHTTLCELWMKLKRNKGYKRHIVSLYRVLKRIGFYNQVLIIETSKYKSKKYNTPKQLDKKWQMDVKYVPNECKNITNISQKKFKQTMVLNLLIIKKK